MLAGGYSWRLFFYVEFAFGAALLVLAFLFVEETQYKRKTPNAIPSPASSQTGERKVFSQAEVNEKDIPVEHVEVQTLIPPRKSFISTLKPWSAIDREQPFFLPMVRFLSYYLIPSVFWVVTSYGIYIGLGALAFNYTFPIKIVAPPYNWNKVGQRKPMCHFLQKTDR